MSLAYFCYFCSAEIAGALCRQRKCLPMCRLGNRRGASAYCVAASREARDSGEVRDQPQRSMGFSQLTLLFYVSEFEGIVTVY
jgi:hypothetical protein